MGRFSMVHWLVFGIVTVLLFGNRLPSVTRSLRRSYQEFRAAMRDRELREIQLQLRARKFNFQYRGPTMREHFKKFLWTWKFWAVLGLVGCVSGLYFQRVAANGSGLWCLGLIFLGAAYLEQQD